ncbi:MAG TPA: hypothetical protein VFL59_11375 [Candidatus Nanopelagicales bacterium]|nr:hypothetical protein [Candidatus Nanopelagicales bacterium]
MKHAAPEPERRWFGLRRAKEPVVDLREPEAETVVIADDAASVVARMARLRDAGLITAAEYEHERRRILGSENGIS